VPATKAGLYPQDVLGCSGGGRRSLVGTNLASKRQFKDTNPLKRLAEDSNSPIPAVAAIREAIKSAANRGWGDENTSAVIKAWNKKRACGLNARTRTSGEWVGLRPAGQITEPRVAHMSRAPRQAVTAPL
jgi:hypothetical protein